MRAVGLAVAAAAVGLLVVPGDMLGELVAGLLAVPVFRWVDRVVAGPPRIDGDAR